VYARASSRSSRPPPPHSPRHPTATNRRPRHVQHVLTSPTPRFLQWSVEEEDALRAGVEKYGSGKWRFIQKDAYLSSVLHLRSNVDLKVRQTVRRSPRSVEGSIDRGIRRNHFFVPVASSRASQSLNLILVPHHTSLTSLRVLSTPRVGQVEEHVPRGVLAGQGGLGASPNALFVGPRGPRAGRLVFASLKTTAVGFVSVSVSVSTISHPRPSLSPHTPQEYDSEEEPPAKRARARAPAKPAKAPKPAKASSDDAERDVEEETTAKPRKKETDAKKPKQSGGGKPVADVAVVKRGPGRPPGSSKTSDGKPTKLQLAKEKLAKLAVRAKKEREKAKGVSKPRGRPATGRPVGRPAKGLSTEKKSVGRQAGDTAAKRPVGRPPAAGGTKDADKTAATAKRRRETKDADAPAKRPRGRPPKAKEDVKRIQAGTDASPSGDGDDDGDVSEKENESDEEDEAVSDDDARTPSARGLEEPVRSANVTAASAKPPLPPVFIVRGQYRTADEVTKDAAKAVREAEAAAAAAERAAETAERREREAWEAERLASRLLEEAERQRREADEAEEDAAGGGGGGAAGRVGGVTLGVPGRRLTGKRRHMAVITSCDNFRGTGSSKHITSTL
jgi:hypothetical protein